MKKISLLDIKEALKDARFRNTLPIELQEDVAKFLTNPGCACNLPLYRKLAKDYSSYLKAYFPNGEIIDEAKEVENLSKNNFSVINCHVTELEGRLRKLPPGRKQIAVTRFQDQATAIINELEQLF